MRAKRMQRFPWVRRWQMKNAAHVKKCGACEKMRRMGNVHTINLLPSVAYRFHDSLRMRIPAAKNSGWYSGRDTEAIVCKREEAKKWM